MLKVAKEDGIYIVSLFQVNKLNTLFSELISQQLNNLVSIPDRNVIFNLEGIRFIDTAGFKTLETAHEIALSRGAKFQLCNIGEEVKELLRETNVRNPFQILPSLNVREKILMELDD